MLFSEIVGNPKAKHFLERMLDSHHVPHTLLFTGREGVGKSLFARYFSKALVGEQKIERVLLGNHPDVHIYSPEGKGGLHSISNMRQLMDEASLAPFEAKSKVFIIEDADRMLAASSNALLKTLEEPPLNTYFILIASDPKSLLPTILSRCCIVFFFPVSQNEIFEYTEKKFSKSKDDAHRIALLAQGSVARAQDLAMDKEEDVVGHIADVFRFGCIKDYMGLKKAIALLEESVEQQAEELAVRRTDFILEQIAYLFRDLHLLNLEVNPEYLYFQKQRTILEEQSKKTLPSMEIVLDHLNRARYAIEHHVKLSVVLEQFFLALA
jgi:DNA polymerase III subunit delta'